MNREMNELSLERKADLIPYLDKGNSQEKLQKNSMLEMIQ